MSVTVSGPASLEQRLVQLVRRFDAVESGLKLLQQQLGLSTSTSAGPQSPDAGTATAATIAARPHEGSTKVLTDLPALQPDPQDPPEVAKLRRYCFDAGLHSAEFLWVPSNYYQESLQWRRDVLHAPSIRHLCKTILMENTHCTNTNCADPRNSRYYYVVYQYVDRFNSDMVSRLIRECNPGLGKKKFNFRVAHPVEAEKLTGVRSGAVAPFGGAVPIPIIVSAGIPQLSPPCIYLGGGHIDCKIRLDTAEFLAVTSATVAPICEPLTEEELAHITD